MYSDIVKEIVPGWFSESKYEALKDYGPKEFHELIVIRQAFKDPLSVVNFYGIQEEGINPISQFFTDPISLEDPFYPNKGCCNSVWQPNSVITTNLLYTTFREQDGTCHIVKINDESEDNVRVGSLSSGDLAPILIDLSAPNKKIEQDFKKWLKQKRSSFAKQKNIPSQSFEEEKKRIIDQKVFQFIDLMTWFELYGESVTHNQMAEILFPNSFKIGDDIKNTTISHSKRVFSWSYTNWLAHVS